MFVHKKIRTQDEVCIPMCTWVRLHICTSWANNELIKEPILRKPDEKRTSQP